MALGKQEVVSSFPFRILGIIFHFVEIQCRNQISAGAASAYVSGNTYADALDAVATQQLAFFLQFFNQLFAICHDNSLLWS